MRSINITSARKELYSLVEAVNCDSVPVLITGKNGNAVLISEEDWNAIQDKMRGSSAIQLPRGIARFIII